MGRLVAALMLTTALVLTGCGTDTPDEADESPPGEPGMSIGDPVQEPTVVALVSASDAGGRVSAEPAPIGDAASLATFTDRFGGRLARDIAEEARNAGVPEGQTLLAAVVGVGCDPVESVDVEVVDGGPTVVAPHQKSDQQCLVPVTTVALVTAVL